MSNETGDSTGVRIKRRGYASWGELIAADGIDAVLIGTWPYMHKPITEAALESGRHVLCQARMAMKIIRLRVKPVRHRGTRGRR